jgi:hypothetical protein
MVMSKLLAHWVPALKPLAGKSVPMTKNLSDLSGSEWPSKPSSEKSAGNLPVNDISHLAASRSGLEPMFMAPKCKRTFQSEINETKVRHHFDDLNRPMRRYQAVKLRMNLNNASLLQLHWSNDPANLNTRRRDVSQV